MKKLIIAISSIFMLMLSSAMSMEMRPAVGISGNMGVYAATGIEENFNNTGTAIDETTKEYGAFATEYGSIFLELGLNDVVSLGVDYVPQALETPQNKSSEGNGGNANTVEAHFEDLTTVYAKINVPLGGTYLKLGYTQAEVISKEIMTSGNSFGNDSTSGYTVGLGYNHEVANGFSVRAEITGSDFSDVQTNNGATNKVVVKVKDMIGARGTISLVKAF